jgi:hypothetical protein
MNYFIDFYETSEMVVTVIGQKVWSKNEPFISEVFTMKTKLQYFFKALTLAAISTLSLQPATTFAQGTAFTYQGQLTLNGTNATGLYNFKFDVWNDPSAGSVIGGPVTNAAVPVTNGLFTTIIDFGGAPFKGTTNYMHIQVATNGSEAFNSLSPRVELTPTPYAIYAESGNAAGLSGTVPAGDLNLTGVSGSGLTSLNASNLTSGTVPAGRLPADVAYTDVTQTFTGTNTFNTGTNAGRLTVAGSAGIDTSLFTGLGLQYNSGSGEGAIMSSFNNGFASLTFYTKQGSGYPVAEQMLINRYGVVAIDQQNANSGVINNGTTNGAGLTFGTGSGEGIASQRTAGLNQYGLDFYTDSDRRMSILHNGNVGIGTTSPSTALQVSGTVTASSVALPLPVDVTAGGSSLLYADNSKNSFVGPSAGDLATPGAYNTANGYEALSNITNAAANTAVGALTLSQNITGNNNTAVGADALAYNTSGSYNTAIGVGGLEGSSGGANTGSNNVALGAFALGNVTSDNGLVAVGYQALQNDASGAGLLTIGGANTAIGYQALQADNSGADNTALGYQSLLSDTSGANNTAIGADALLANTGGSGNIAIGELAGFSLGTDANNNIDIGSDGDSGDSGIIRIGTQGTQNATYVVTPVAVDGEDLDNGLSYLSSGETAVPGGAGVFLFGYNGGSLGVSYPNTACLSWTYQGNVWVSNNMSVASLTIRSGADLAEPFNITSGKDEVPQGAVVVIDEQNPGHLKLSDSPYDTHVAGVVSGANGVNPGIQMHQQGLIEGGQNVALSGRVYVQADTSNGAIRPGDMLTTSGTPGRAMKVSDHARAAGAILGKAMTGLSEGQGMVLVLVTLQ